jgi:hypothetical protein
MAWRLAVALFRHAMVVLETLFLGNDSGSLVNAAQSLPETSPARQDRDEDGASVMARVGKHGLIVIGNNLI